MVRLVPNSTGQGFDGKAQPLVQHGEQDLIGERHGGWPARFDSRALLVEGS
ncbi:hypothetical protein [Nonomuraea rubra]|uniref:hypothetical protein n=1 Tax=Nonomuraea rubra TaxID=46180 RepID=UPI0033D060FE